MVTVYLTRVEHFSAAHRLHSNALTDEQNAALYDKCNREGGHGHNYRLEVTVAGTPDPQTGMLLNLTDLRDCILAHVIQRIDHYNIDRDIGYFRDVVSTTENVAIWIWKQLVEVIPRPARLAEIRLHETEKNIVTYRGE